MARRAFSIIKDPSHSGHHLFKLHPWGRLFMAIKSMTNRLKNSFYSSRSKESIWHALIELIEEITKLLNKYICCRCIHLSQKTFDTINHNILISKLKQCGIQGSALNWMKSYIKNRKQFAKMGEFESHVLTLCVVILKGPNGCWVPICSFYTLMRCKMSPILRCILFVDGSNISASGENLQQFWGTVAS